MGRCRFAVTVCLLALLAACTSSGVSIRQCSTDHDCPDGGRCGLSGACLPAADGDLDLDGSDGTDGVDLADVADSTDEVDGMDEADSPGEWDSPESPDGDLPAGTIVLTPERVDFGPVEAGCCAPARLVTIANSGAVALFVSSVTVDDGAETGFSVVGPAWIGRLDPGEQRQVEVVFCPPPGSTAGPATGRLSIESDSPADPVAHVGLSGRALLRTTVTDRFVQDGAPDVDLLWVLDSSGSMGMYLGQLESAIGNLLYQASIWRAYTRMAVIDAVLDDPDRAGRFLGDPPIITSTMHDFPERFADALAELAMGSGGGGQEAGLEAARIALSPPLSTDQNLPNSRFVRAGAVLALVFVSDEEDQSPDAVGEYVDFLRGLKGARHPDLVRAFALVPTGSACPGLDPSVRYPEAALALSGSVHPICDSEYDGMMAAIGDRLFATTLLRFFPLSAVPDPDTLMVTVDGRPAAGWSWQAEGNLIVFELGQEPPLQSGIEVDYLTPCGESGQGER